MADNAQKTWLARSLNRFAETKVQNAIQVLGRALPASVVSVSGSIVTVKFEVTSNFTLPNVTVPMMGPQYIRYPIQQGDGGVVLSADVSLGQISGYGGSAPELTIPANLSALMFVPIANKTWSETDDPNKLVLYGPDGAVLRTIEDTCGLTVDDNGVTLKVPPGKSLIVNTLPVAPTVAGGFYQQSGFVRVA